MEKYKEIQELYQFCKDNGIECEFGEMFGGYCITFKVGDVVQHNASYGRHRGCVEFGYTGTKKDFVATTLEEAKKFVLEHFGGK